jgi:hypothetical protein
MFSSASRIALSQGGHANQLNVIPVCVESVILVK